MPKNWLVCSSGGQIHKDGVTTVSHLICDSGLFYSRVQACWRHNGVRDYTAKLLKKKHFVLDEGTFP